MLKLKKIKWSWYLIFCSRTWRDRVLLCVFPTCLLLSLISFFFFSHFSLLWVEIQFKGKQGWMKHWFKAVQHQHTQRFQWPIFHGLWREWNISIHLTLEASWKGTVTLLRRFVFYLKCKLTNYNCWEEYKIQRTRELFFLVHSRCSY